MTLIVPEKNHVEALKRTYELVGPLYEVLVDQDGKVLQGANRLATGMNWPTRTKLVESNLQRLLIRLLGNVQRQPKEEEVKYLLTKIAEELVATQKIPEAEVCNEICKMFSPQIYTDRRIRQLLEDKYKVGYKVDAGRKGGEKTAETVSAETDENSEDEGSEADSGAHADKVMEDAEEEAEETKTLLDDMSKKVDDSPAYPYPECACPNCSHKKDCY
jgi:hypothetical protein